MIGNIRSTTIEPKKENPRKTITVAGVTGLIMSLFIAFLWEYIEESKARRKGKRQG
jgi:uncharacterized protein involved in exopolysaccharide biosynthesis